VVDRPAREFTGANRFDDRLRASRGRAMQLVSARPRQWPGLIDQP
jgi:hypothetical protein